MWSGCWSASAGSSLHARRGDAPDETAIAVAAERIRELEEFAARLRQVEEQGFACKELDEFIAAEPLDRWSGDGVFPPASHAALLAQEQAWTVDINDGVRVNVAPLQVAGLLASDVLAAKELGKAIADRGTLALPTSGAGCAPASCPAAAGWRRRAGESEPGRPSRRSGRRSGCGWRNGGGRPTRRTGAKKRNRDGALQRPSGPDREGGCFARLGSPPSRSGARMVGWARMAITSTDSGRNGC